MKEKEDDVTNDPPIPLVQNPHASSIDSSRIIRADYANAAYTRLATRAQEKWRGGWPFDEESSSPPRNDVQAQKREQAPQDDEDDDDDREGNKDEGMREKRRNSGERKRKTKRRKKVYTESGILVTAGRGTVGEGYVRAAQRNSEEVGQSCRSLDGARDVRDSAGVGDFSRGWNGKAVKNGEVDDEHAEDDDDDDVLGDAIGETSYGYDYGYISRHKGMDKRRRKHEGVTEGAELGELGYENMSSGWADAAGAMEGLMQRVVVLSKARNQRRDRGSGEGMVVFRRGKARRLLFSTIITDAATSSDPSSPSTLPKVTGAELDSDSGGDGDGSVINVDITVLAAGAWSPALLDLRGRVEARGQVLAYVPITIDERERLKDMKVVLNLGSGMFGIPPCFNVRTGNWEVKIARHAFGYANFVRVSLPGLPPSLVTTTTTEKGESEASVGKAKKEGEVREEGEAIVSIPHERFEPIPEDGMRNCRRFLRSMLPTVGDREWSATRLCWYADTPTGDFVVDYHPGCEGLLVATGGSGHAFKFLPVMGPLVVKRLEGRLGRIVGGRDGDGEDGEVLEERELARLWRWREQGREGEWWAEDGSRGGSKGVVLTEEWEKGEKERRQKWKGLSKL